MQRTPVRIAMVRHPPMAGSLGRGLRKTKQYSEMDTSTEVARVPVPTWVKRYVVVPSLRAEEKQRVLGFIPNFYTVYDRNAVPLTPKLKFRLALKTTTDPITFLGSAFLAGLDQADNNHNYGQGGKAYGQRFGAHYANGLTDIVIGGAILPTLLHQDPRYFYQGTGTKKSRMLHALSTPFICRGDNGRLQPNYSSLGGYLASGAISNAYYPASNRGPGLVLSTALIDITANMANSLLQEFVLRRLTPS